MTRLTLALISHAVAIAALAQEPEELLIRYSIQVNPVNYPQKTPQEATKSVVKALDSGRLDYMLAQIVEPKFVDARVAEYYKLLFSREELLKEDEEIARELDPIQKKLKIIEKTKKERARVIVAFNRLVNETKKHFDEDPVLLKELRLMARDAEWDADDAKAVGSLKKLTTRRVFLKKNGERWFMEERQY